MILSDKIVIHLYKNKEYYKNKGYDVNESLLEINVCDLPDKSNMKIEVKCDICDSVKKIRYQDYLKNIKNGGYYSCNKCVNVKNKKTRLELYGDENYNNRQKQKETCIKIFGVDSYTKTVDYIKKTKNAHQIKYDVDYYNQTDEFKNKAKEKCLKKYNKEHYSQTEECIENSKETCLKKYGETHYSKTSICKEQVKITSKYKYGYEYYSSTTECRNRVKLTCLEKYGVEYPIQNQIIFNKQQASAYKIKKFKELTYQGSYELDFLEKYYNIIKLEKPKSIKYIYENKEKFYYPDFFIPELNLIVEIKNSYLAKKDELIIEQKRNSVLQNGYNYIMIIEKNYTEFDKLYFL